MRVKSPNGLGLAAAVMAVLLVPQPASSVGIDQPSPLPPPPSMRPTPDAFLIGLKDGTRSCAQALENITEAALAFAQGDFVRAQRLLGIDRADIASQMLAAITTDLTIPVATEPLTPYAQGYRMSRRLCTYATLWQPRGPGAKGGAVEGNVQALAQQGWAQQGWARGLESGGADAWSGETRVDPFSGKRFKVMGRSRRPASHATSTYANKSERLGYHEARFTQGEIGLQAPTVANVAGTDFITAARAPGSGLMEIIVTDVKTSMKGNFPAPKTTIPGSWRTEVYDAVGRLQLSDTALEAEIVDAALNSRIRLRQLNVDLASATQGVTGQPLNISGW